MFSTWQCSNRCALVQEYLSVKDVELSKRLQTCISYHFISQAQIDFKLMKEKLRKGEVLVFT